jgi:hypothetical protein
MKMSRRNFIALQPEEFARSSSFRLVIDFLMESRWKVERLIFITVRDYA